VSAFLVTGLPRSKTAWMSVVASMVPDAICYHEPVTRFKRWECCFDIWKNPTTVHVGIADSGLGFHLDRILADVAPQILIIRRDPQQVKESLKRLNPTRTNYVDLLSESLDAFSTSPGVRSVAFDDLAHPDTVADCLNHLIPGSTLAKERISELINLNIQVDLDRFWKLASANRAHAAEMLGAGVIPRLHLS
jgi:hypothetical protein